MIGLALQGGGAKGAAHVGVLRALTESGLFPDSLAGTSAGSMAAAAYAWRGEMQDLEDLLSMVLQLGPKILDLNFGGILGLILGWFTRRDSHFTGIFRGKRLEKIMTDATQGATLQEAKLPLAIPAVDLLSGGLYVYSAYGPGPGSPWTWQRNATLAEAVRASSAIPLVFCPRPRQDALLVDGGVLQNLPAAALRRIGTDKILGVRLCNEGSTQAIPRDMLGIARQTLQALEKQMERQQGYAADHLLEIHLPGGSGILSFEAMQSFVDLGYETTLRTLPLLKEWWRRPGLAAPAREVSGRSHLPMLSRTQVRGLSRQ